MPEAAKPEPADAESLQDSSRELNTLFMPEIDVGGDVMFSALSDCEYEETVE